ncbi:hypothetical protein ACWKWW_01595 [Chryseobacterium cucumeris]
MKKSLSVLLSDQTSKYGTRFEVSAMEDLIWKHSEMGIPIHLSHDIHRPVGIMNPLGLYLESNLVRNLGICLIPETDSEETDVLSFKKYSYIKRISDRVDNNKKSLFDQVAASIVDKIQFIDAGTLAIVNKGIVKRLFPDLYASSLNDKNNLIKLKDLQKEFDYKYQGIFIHKTLPLCIYCHHYFRRSLSRYNNFHYIFLDELMSYRHNNDIEIKIALDWDMIGYGPDVLQSMEFEFWFGPKYDDDISNIDNGLTQHKTEEHERIYYGISSTEFFWKSNKELKEFELEELRESDIPTEPNMYGCRYVHSIFDTTKQIFNHFDGAIRGYNAELYFERIDQKMTDFGRRSDYKKLFRIDGKLPLSKWKSLVTNYMQDNPLIYEYFGIDKPEGELQQSDETVRTTLTQQFMPYKIEKEDGIKVLVSYHDKPNIPTNLTHCVLIYDCISYNNIDKNIIEDEIIEIKKHLKQKGKELHIDSDILYAHSTDEYLNIPCIFHSATNPQQDVKDTIEVLKLIFTKIIERNLSKKISFSLSWNIEEKNVIISCVGHIENLLPWLSSLKNIPTDREQMKDWLETLKIYLNTENHKVTDERLLNTICQHDGILYFKRLPVSDEFIENLNLENDNLNCILKIPDDHEKYREIIDKELTPCISYFGVQYKCSICNGDYSFCEHSKWTDQDCSMIVEKFEHPQLYWTDKISY